MAFTRPPVLPSWAETGDTTQPTNLEIQEGWPLTDEPPTRQRFNWAFNLFHNAVNYFGRRGIADYSADETYAIYDRVMASNGKTYSSLENANIDNEPSASPTKWARWGFTLAELIAEIFVQNLVSNGYLKFPGGFILQWGQGTSAANGKLAVTWPVAFTVALAAGGTHIGTSAVVVILDNSGGGTGITTTTGNFGTANTFSGLNGPYPFFWWAFGK